MIEEKKSLPINGGIAAQDSTSQSDVGQALVWPVQSVNFTLSSEAIPSVLCGVYDLGAGFQKQLTALTAERDSFGNNRLSVVTFGGGLVPKAPTAVSVGVADGSLLAADTIRRHVVIVNTSANTVSLAFGNAAVLNSGITLMGSGGSFEMSEAQGNLYLGEIRAIASAAASNVSIQESD